MIETTVVEDRLRSLFGAIAAQVEDESARSHLGSVGAGIEGEAPDTTPSELPRHKLSHGTMVGVIAGGAIILATAAAAAAGALPFSLSSVLGPAGSILGAAKPPAAAHAVLRVSEVGPQGTTLKVFSAMATKSDLTAGDCWSLTIDTPTGAPASGSVTTDKGACSLVVSQNNPLTSRQQEQASHGGQAVTSWISPSGAAFDIVFGEGVPGTAYVALTNASGEIGAKVASTNSWFAIYISQAGASSYNRITFLNASGAVLTILPGAISSSPPA